MPAEAANPLDDQQGAPRWGMNALTTALPLLSPPSYEAAALSSRKRWH